MGTSQVRGRAVLLLTMDVPLGVPGLRRDGHPCAGFLLGFQP